MHASACPIAGRDRANIGKIFSAALRGLAAVWRTGLYYKKAGVMLLDPARADRVQSALFDEIDDDGRRPAFALSISSTAASAATRTALHSAGDRLFRMD